MGMGSPLMVLSAIRKHNHKGKAQGSVKTSLKIVYRK